MIKIDKNKTDNLITLTVNENSTLLPGDGVVVKRVLNLYNKGNSDVIVETIDLTLLTDLSTNLDRYNQYEIDGTTLNVETLGELNYSIVEFTEPATIEVILEVGLIQIEDSSVITPKTEFSKTKEDTIYFK